jgi:glutaredoxin
MSASHNADEINVYWQPGCTSCLRTKEFLTKNGVPFISRNVLADDTAFDELAALGLRSVPIVTRNGEWVDGQVLKDVARIAGIHLVEQKMFPPEELQRRLLAVLDGTIRFTRQLPEDSLGTMQPNRPRSYRDLVYHIVNIDEAFLEHEAGIPLVAKAYDRVPGHDMQTKEQLVAYAADIRGKMVELFAKMKDRDWNAPAQVYYGKQSLHDYLERTTWHSGQHSRQLMWALNGLGIQPEHPLGKETFGGLPMPEQVWENVEDTART